MEDTTVVNMKTSPYDVAIDRSSPFGNPFPLRNERERGAVLQRYREYFYRRVERDAEFRERVRALRGKRLGCHCAPKPCHGMIIVEWLEADAKKRKR
ncbi:MAG: DUF4326 domain-containing protein [Candidatus Sigynarchaeota archaeon]